MLINDINGIHRFVILMTKYFERLKGNEFLDAYLKSYESHPLHIPERDLRQVRHVYSITIYKLIKYLFLYTS